MDLNEITVFVKVVQSGSFTGAAIALGMPKSTVSSKITGLEKRLGATLLMRSTRKLRLTPAGEGFFLRATKSLEELLAAETDVRSENIEPQGKFKLTAPVDLGNQLLAELMWPFLKRYPKVQAEVILAERYVDLLAEGIDLAIRAGDLKDSSLIAKRVGEVSFRIYASPKYLKLKGEPKDVKDLQSHDCILISSISSSEWKLQNGKRVVSVPLSGKLVVNDIELAHKLAVQGAGLAFLPTWLCDIEVKAERLIPILGDWRSKSAPIHFVYPGQKYVRPATKAFIEMSTAALQARIHRAESR